MQKAPQQTPFEQDRDDLVTVLRRWAGEQGDRVATVYLEDGTPGSGEIVSSYADLDRSARRIAAWLQARTRPGDRVLLAHLPGPAFLDAFLGCLYAGVIAVPAPPPDGRRRSLARLSGIVADAGIGHLLTDTPTMPLLREWLDSGDTGLEYVASDDLDACSEDWQPPRLDGDTVAFLQYTSGSTSTPKGVIVTHGNIVANHEAIREAAESTSEIRGVGWLPHFHDMGLIGQLLHPLYVGGTLYYMSPLAFLKRPCSWLEAISHYRATITPAPNFAYELAARRVSDEQLAQLDLSSLEVALNGAEPISIPVLERFARRFAPAGLRAESLSPCYGLAEATLLVTGTPRLRGLRTYAADAASFQQGWLTPASSGAAVQHLVSSGRAGILSVRIVDPATLSGLPEGRIGEIWVTGPSVGAGYWNNPELTEETFAGTTADGQSGFLRTGDLGVLLDGELYVTGRIKDLIIVNGRNLYPHDIEESVRSLHPALATGAAAAFSLGGHPEHVVLVQEIKPRYLDGTGTAELAATVASHIRHTFQIPRASTLLVAPGSVERTTSGKIQRGRMRELYLRDALTALEVAPAEETVSAGG
ncbi:fatty acyl-AMP ligase [Streptomyces sp. NPDC051954]|uniref:fatty acyl-AMP ligase n=1 Tax=unclassified Streptomyces TaxID=2593676 RepID=UPI003420304D